MREKHLGIQKIQIKQSNWYTSPNLVSLWFSTFKTLILFESHLENLFKNDIFYLYFTLAKQ